MFWETAPPVATPLPVEFTLLVVAPVVWELAEALPPIVAACVVTWFWLLEVELVALLSCAFPFEAAQVFVLLTAVAWPFCATAWVFIPFWAWDELAPSEAPLVLKVEVDPLILLLLTVDAPFTAWELSVSAPPAVELDVPTDPPEANKFDWEFDPVLDVVEAFPQAALVFVLTVLHESAFELPVALSIAAALLIELAVDPTLASVLPLVACALWLTVLLEVVVPVTFPLPEAAVLELLLDAPFKLFWALPFWTWVTELRLLFDPELRLTVPLLAAAPLALEFDAPVATVLLFPLFDKFSRFILLVDVEPTLLDAPFFAREFATELDVPTALTADVPFPEEIEDTVTWLLPFEVALAVGRLTFDSELIVLIRTISISNSISFDLIYYTN